MGLQRQCAIPLAARRQFLGGADFLGREHLANQYLVLGVRQCQFYGGRGHGQSTLVLNTQPQLVAVCLRLLVERRACEHHRCNISSRCQFTAQQQTHALKGWPPLRFPGHQRIALLHGHLQGQ